MNVRLSEILKNIPSAIKSPGRAIVIFWRRVFPFGIRPKDPEAYRIGSWSYGKIPRVFLTDVFPGIENVDVTIHRTFNRVMGTSMDLQEIITVSAVVKFTGAKNILEIGTYDGNTALNLAANSLPDAFISTVDLPPDWNGRLELKVPELKVNVIDSMKIGIQFKKTKYSKKIKQIFSDSAKIDWNEIQTPLDIVIIDGCHDYVYVKGDTQNALKYLKSGGILIWHDYGMMKDVSQVVDETAKRLEVKAIRGTRLAIGFKE